MAARTRIPTDEDFMRRALRLAQKGEGRVSPNPLVGAVIVRQGRIIAEGYHHRYGERHAEIDALANATEPVAGATFYVTLEPCSHHGKTPPCVDALIASRPARVVVGSIDPNPLVSGTGIAALRRHGIETITGVLADACQRQNEVFFKYIRTGIPYVTLKFALTLDGRIATAAGDSRWVSSPPSLRFAHRLRRSHDAILVGADTVLKDDPELTCRLVRGKDPLRIVVDSHLRTPPEARLFDQRRARTIIAATAAAPRKRRLLFEDRGIEVLELGEDDEGRVDLPGLLTLLGTRNIASLLVEGGAGVNTSFLRGGLVDRLVAVVAPKIVGVGIDAVGDLGIRRMEQALRLRFVRIVRRGDDLILDARFTPRPQAAPPPP
ncbi:MAG: bifunctional diaminohydroxyphosphoribosylaminopyrimidine deaminase/5-amino-6-(5-phosphoribosylamino)uracil reductase RibD [Syntrophales bacterium]